MMVGDVDAEPKELKQARRQYRVCVLGASFDDVASLRSYKAHQSARHFFSLHLPKVIFMDFL